MKTKWTKRIKLGSINDEVFYLLPPKFDGRWYRYWSFGCLRSKHSLILLDTIHHGSGFNISNFLMNISDLNPKIRQNIWLFLDLSFTVYDLKTAAEILGRGNVNYTTNPSFVNLVKHTQEVDRINNIVIPELLDNLYDLIK
jgi:hypothetical protein